MDNIVLKTKRGTWIIDIAYRNILGRGAFGFVYKATDDKGKKVAAKYIDTHQRQNVPEVYSHFMKLTELNHQYIAKVFDVHEEKHRLWLISKLWEYGNLNQLCARKSMGQEERVHVMLQIASGIKYLHEQDVIHGDLSPQNILVASESPIRVKLADFDVSKFLGECGWMAKLDFLPFRSPEYFRRGVDTPVIYSRGLDSYVAGLIFLALVQYREGQKHLIPRIETPRDETEVKAPSPGQLIAERIKYNVGKLYIAVLPDVSDPTAASGNAELNRPYDVTTEVKQLIQNLTHVESEDRWSAAQAFECLAEIKLKLAQAKQRENQAKEKEAAAAEEEKREKARGNLVAKCNVAPEKSPLRRIEALKTRTSSDPALMAADVTRTWECQYCGFLANNASKEICDKCDKSKEHLLCQGCAHDNPVGSRICEECMQVLKEPPIFLW